MSIALRVVVALDSFKGSIDAADATRAFGAGWSAVRPEDHLDLLPMADGGEGTLAVLESAASASRRVPIRVTGPDGRPADTAWLLCADGTAVVEMSGTSGLPLMREPDPIGATSTGLGEALRAAALSPDVRRLVVGLGGSACTDGGAGALAALGARPIDVPGRPEGLDLSDLVAPPPGGVICLVDVTAPLLGPFGAARQFAPQKGADAEQVLALEASLTRWVARLGGDPAQPGSGAAGGTAYGLVSGWGAELAAGSTTLADAIGLPEAIRSADLVVTGEGRYDSQSAQGKVVGHVLGLARDCGTRSLVVAGTAEGDLAAGVLQLAELAGGADAAMAQPARWLERPWPSPRAGWSARAGRQPARSRGRPDRADYSAARPHSSRFQKGPWTGLMLNGPPTFSLHSSTLGRIWRGKEGTASAMSWSASWEAAIRLASSTSVSTLSSRSSSPGTFARAKLMPELPFASVGMFLESKLALSAGSG
ncbi:Glycerate kinase (modular protein) [metagenome]|uniref:Glycerate kinase (Modular protein) n=1 Tax=metagenome TaxID=256318 RepID=A0A2P2C158_9ZZZZ